MNTIEAWKEMEFLPLSLLLLVLTGLLANADNIWPKFMPKDQDPDKGPQNQDTVYIPGEPGGQWTPEEVDSTRQRILLMITPLWLVQMAMVGCSWRRGCVESDVVYENALIRLAFHDCVPYADGTGGCNGCLDWNGMIKTEGNYNFKTG